jgi:hypothetical protein
VGVWANNWKQSSGGSVLGTPVKMDGERNGRGWWDVGNEVVVEVYLAVQKCEQGRGFGPKIRN